MIIILHTIFSPCSRGRLVEGFPTGLFCFVCCCCAAINLCYQHELRAGEGICVPHTRSVVDRESPAFLSCYLCNVHILLLQTVWMTHQQDFGASLGQPVVMADCCSVYTSTNVEWNPNLASESHQYWWMWKQGKKWMPRISFLQTKTSYFGYVPLSSLKQSHFQFKGMFFRHIEALQGLGYQEQTPCPCHQLSKQRK